MKKIIYITIIILLLFLSCENKQSRILLVATDAPVEQTEIEEHEEEHFSETVQKLRLLGLVDIHDYNPDIFVELKYATPDNFTGKILYDDLTSAYMQPKVAQMLSKAQHCLDSISPEMHLLVYDAVRPVSVQRKMYELVQDSHYRNYVAHPDKTGLHNYGAAVDLTICDSSRNPLDMGTSFDSFTGKSGINKEEELVESGLLTREQVNNRKLLQKVMRFAGFIPIHGEWWHFNACSLSEAKKFYLLVD